MVGCQPGRKFEVLLLDGGGELMSKEFIVYLRACDIRRNLILAQKSHQNGL